MTHAINELFLFFDALNNFLIKIVLSFKNFKERQMYLV